MPAPASITRRDILRGKPNTDPFRPRPPGVEPAGLNHCTHCGDCVNACPERVLGIARDGVVFLPERGECTFCGDCAKACSEDVFTPNQIMAHRFEISTECLANAGIACMTCRDACPNDAITMTPRIGGPFLPKLHTAACTGCGACVAPCPVDAIRAVAHPEASNV